MSLKPTGPRGAYVPAAPRYDGRSRDWMLDSNGRRTSIHPIDSGVQMAMAAQKGELTSSLTTGNEILSLVTDLGGPRQHEQVVACIESAQPIARYLQEGSITILSVEDSLIPNGGIFVTLNYRNNLTGRDESATSA